jgi:hypothetical protein
MLFSVDPDIFSPVEAIIFTIVKGSSEIGLCFTGHISHIVGPKELVKQEHVSLPSIPGPQSRFDVDKARVLATHIGHDVSNLKLVINKGSSRVRLYRTHLFVHSFISICRVLIFRLDFNVPSHNIIQGSSTLSILLYCFKSSGPVIFVYHWFLFCILETYLMPLLILVATNQNQVDCICNGLALDSLHVLQIIHTKLHVSNCPDGDRDTIVARSNCCYSSSCLPPPRICDSFDCCIYIVNAIQVGNLIQRINATGARQIGRRGCTEDQSLQHSTDHFNGTHFRIEN